MTLFILDAPDVGSYLMQRDDIIKTIPRLPRKLKTAYAEYINENFGPYDKLVKQLVENGLGVETADLIKAFDEEYAGWNQKRISNPIKDKIIQSFIEHNQSDQDMDSFIYQLPQHKQSIVWQLYKKFTEDLETKKKDKLNYKWLKLDFDMREEYPLPDIRGFLHPSDIPSDPMDPKRLEIFYEFLVQYPEYRKWLYHLIQEDDLDDHKALKLYLEYLVEKEEDVDDYFNDLVNDGKKDILFSFLDEYPSYRKYLADVDENFDLNLESQYQQRLRGKAVELGSVLKETGLPNLPLANIIDHLYNTEGTLGLYETLRMLNEQSSP